MKRFIRIFIFRIIIYALILTATFYAFRFIFYHFNLLYTSVDNARYLLSAIAQSQAAIIAIIVTVSLVAVQLGASTYSPRIVNIFKKNPDLWILLALYGTSISYNFIILKILSEKTSEFYIFVCYWLCASTFLALFPYVLSMMSILSPQAITRRLLEDISLPRLNLGNREEDTFQPAVDIVRNAFMKNDYETVRRGLRGITTKSIEVINSYDIEKYRFIPGERNPYNPFKDFLEYYCKHLTQIGRLFAERDENLTLEAIENLNRVGGNTIKKKIEVEKYMISALRVIGVVSAEKELKEATTSAMDSIAAIGKTIPYEDYASPVDQNLVHTEEANHVIDALYDIGVAAVKKWGVYAAHFVGRNLEAVGATIAQKRLLWGTVAAARSLNNVGVIALSVEENSAYDQSYSIINHDIIRPLKEIGKIAHGKGIKRGFGRTAFALWDIGIMAEKRRFNDATYGAAKALAELAILDEEVIEEELSRLKSREARIEPIESTEAFWKFIEVYKKCLKELRTSKDRSQNKEQSL